MEKLVAVVLTSGITFIEIAGAGLTVTLAVPLVAAVQEPSVTTAR